MKIKTVDGGELDSDKMTDIEAEVFEKQMELVDICKKYDIPVVSFVMTTDNRSTGPLSFYISDSKSTNDETILRLAKILKCLSFWIYRITEKTHAIVKLPPAFE